MDIILDWLNAEIGLTPPVRSFERDFSNGYLFGKLLHLYNQNPTLDRFVDKAASNAKINNFSLLDPLFRALKVRFDSKIAYEIITCQPSAALNLVRDLKIVLEKMASRPTAARHPSSAADAHTAAPEQGCVATPCRCRQG